MSINLKRRITDAPPKNKKFYIIAVDGRDGSGKTTLTKFMASLLPDFIFVNGDDYFEPTAGGITWGEFNDARFAKDVINPLKREETLLHYRPYDWHREPHINEVELDITGGICIERCMSFMFDLDFDLRIWVETPREICIERGIAREAMPRKQAEDAWNIWQRQRDEYIAKANPLEGADIVVDGAEAFGNQLS